MLLQFILYYIPEPTEFCQLVVQIYILFVLVDHLLAGLLAPLLPVVLQLLGVPRLGHYFLHIRCKRE